MKYIVLLITLISLSHTSDFENIKLQYFKSYDYEQMGRYTEAIKVLAPLYTKYPKGYTLNLRLGWLFFLNKKYNDAITHYTKASLTKSSAIDPKLGIIRIYLNTDSFSKAEQESYAVVKKDYYNYYANLYLIQALIAQEKHKVSEKIIHKMLAAYPTDITYLEQLVLVYKATKSPYLKTLYQDILILDPNNVLVRSNLL